MANTLIDKIKDLFRSHIDIYRDNENYFESCVHRGRFSFLAPWGTAYDGAYRFHRTHEEVEEIKKRLLPYVKKGKIPAFKVKTKETPLYPKFADKLPPVFVYCLNKDRPRIQKILNSGGISDLVWDKMDGSVETNLFDIPPFK